MLTQGGERSSGAEVEEQFEGALVVYRIRYAQHAFAGRNSVSSRDPLACIRKCRSVQQAQQGNPSVDTSSSQRLKQGLSP
mmetsp:Transcript_5247/g.15689  ORF Transcript_5247/g.15689 Transcript_5247/m.15689 type:complete len:80 (+) Transcript_5247:75-314(+)